MIVLLGSKFELTKFIVYLTKEKIVEPLKEQFYNRAFFEKLAGDFQKHHPGFQRGLFLSLIFDEEWVNRELKERMRHTTQVLHQVLDLSFPAAVELLKKVIDEGKKNDFGKMSFPDYVEQYGLEHLEISLDALAFFTPYASSEFAVRPFILRYPELVMERMLAWAGHSDEHVRRLASEGCRPRLPWAVALPAFKKDPAPVLPILEKLKADPSEYVRRSVANNLNDISKDHPDRVLDIARRWMGQAPFTDKLLKHALRTLLKAGTTDALRLFGFGDPAGITIAGLTLEPKTLRIGEKLHFHFQVINPAAEPALLRLEYIIDFVKKSGKTSSKIFQIAERSFVGNERINRHQTFADLTTRKHYPGEHRLSIIVNGEKKRKQPLSLGRCNGLKQKRPSPQ